MKDTAPVFTDIAERIRRKVEADGEYTVGTAQLCEVTGYDEGEVQRAAQTLAHMAGVWWSFRSEKQTIWFGQSEDLGPAPREGGER